MTRNLNRGMLAALGMLACLGALVAGQEAPAVPCFGGQQQTPDAAEATLEPIPDSGPELAVDSVCPHFAYMNMGSYCVYYSSHYNGSVCQPLSFSSSCGIAVGGCPGPTCLPPCVLAPVPCEAERDKAIEAEDPGVRGYRGPMHHEIDPADTIPDDLPPDISVTVAYYGRVRFRRKADPGSRMIFAEVFKAVVMDENGKSFTFFNGIEVKQAGGPSSNVSEEITRVEGRPWAYHWDHDNNPATAGIEIIAHWKTPGHDQP